MIVRRGGILNRAMGHLAVADAIIVDERVVGKQLVVAQVEIAILIDATILAIEVEEARIVADRRATGIFIVDTELASTISKNFVDAELVDLHLILNIHRIEMVATRIEALIRSCRVAPPTPYRARDIDIENLFAVEVKGVRGKSSKLFARPYRGRREDILALTILQRTLRKRQQRLLGRAHSATPRIVWVVGPEEVRHRRAILENIDRRALGQTYRDLSRLIRIRCVEHHVAVLLLLRRAITITRCRLLRRHNRRERKQE